MSPHQNATIWTGTDSPDTCCSQEVLFSSHSPFPPIIYIDPPYRNCHLSQRKKSGDINRSILIILINYIPILESFLHFKYVLDIMSKYVTLRSPGNRTIYIKNNKWPLETNQGRSFGGFDGNADCKIKCTYSVCKS